MAESRNKTADMELKQVFRGFMDNGNQFLSSQELLDYITSKEIKIKQKKANIAGLQLADLIAYPAKIDILLANNEPLDNTPSAATIRIISGISRLYNKWGRKYLP